MTKISVTVMIPIYNSETILGDVLRGLEKQDYPIDEIILIDNNSCDSSFDLMSEYARKSKFSVKLIRHEKDCGLAYSYNEAISLCKTTHIITLQSDCIIRDNNGVEKLISPFKENDDVVATCSFQITPWEVWEKYNFWQKCLFSRHAGKILSGRNGRFCCFSVDALKKVGMYNEKTYRTAGEDGDIMLRLKKNGKIIDANTIVDHLHGRSPKFSLEDYFYKENQLIEATGACFSQNIREISLGEFATVLIRPILIIGLLIPWINVAAFFLVVIFSIFFTKDVFKKEWRDPRIIALPFLNMALLISSAYFFLKGFVFKKQRL